ncbi:hypothetical protein EB796_001833 [Bugula neritina]|uniref:Uncharacterized protein n=1 Tax=Bugula neritina TaxID=10212 RepID=A0A7J7KNV3_BUGNE|nr:hypothetical protein EB796_001833 [Bugula neritina]
MNHVMSKLKGQPRLVTGFTEQLPSVSQTISATHDCDADSNQAIFSNTPSNCFNSTEDFPDDIDIIFGSPMSETSASEPICAISSQLSPSLTNPSHQQKSHSKAFPTTPLSNVTPILSLLEISSLHPLLARIPIYLTAAFLLHSLLQCSLIIKLHNL